MTPIIGLLSGVATATANVAKATGKIAAQAGKTAFHAARPFVKAAGNVAIPAVRAFLGKVGAATPKVLAATGRGALAGGGLLLGAIRPRPEMFHNSRNTQRARVLTFPVRRRDVVLLCPECGSDDLEWVDERRGVLECQHCAERFHFQDAAVA
jgi:hypothetical protein